MNHPTDDQLLLLAYGELSDVADIESHVAACGTCQQQLAQLERARVILDTALPPRRVRPSATRWAVLALAAAALVAGVLIIRPGSRGAATEWRPTMIWSATAGYVAGGQAMVDIDAQLTRLEQERPYVRP